MKQNFGGERIGNDTMPHDYLQVADSDIHGLGVIANCNLEEGWYDRVHGFLSTIETQYCFDWENGVVFEPYPPFKFLNHDDNPNCIVYDDEYGLYIEVVRPIDKGEELTIDYNYEEEAL